ncbi:RNA polymerase II transcription factor B subunit 1 [Coemansia sp. RSA 552]|nr:RNA polymerase II transcription factor B subunit 1 [Coemansia sp. RSA 552]
MLLLPGEVIKLSSSTMHNKVEGTLHFTNKRLAWCKADTQTPTVEVLHENTDTPRVSKAEAKVMLKAMATIPATATTPARNVGYIFVWKQADRETAVAERDRFVAELRVVLSRRTQGASSGPQASGATGGQAPGGGGGKGGGAAAAESSNEYSQVKIGARPASAEEVKLRQEVLSKNGDLAKVHKSLVISGLVQEDEFWSTRKNILETYAIQSQLRKGESSTWLDLAPTTQETGNFKYTITPSVARRIFKEYPQVKRAYVDNVPHKVGEKVFWKRFVASQFFNRGRSADAFKGRDSIFDKCSLEEDASFNDAKRTNVAFLTRLLDLTRTEEDAVETGNAPDFTMRPSVADNKLPLIRRFNHHSQLVLQSVLNSKRKQVATDHRTVDKSLEEATVLEDLETAPAEKRVKLNIHDRTRYFTSLAIEDAAQKRDAGGPDTGLDISFDIARPLGGCGNTQRTMASMSSATHRLNLQKRPNRIQELGIPDDINVAIAECHGASTEMLRHLWALMRLPPTPERRQKAEKIVAAFDGVKRHIRETIAKANSVEGKNARLGETVEQMLQPTIESLRVGKKEFDSQAKISVGT